LKLEEKNLAQKNFRLRGGLQQGGNCSNVFAEGGNPPRSAIEENDLMGLDVEEPKEEKYGFNKVAATCTKSKAIQTGDEKGTKEMQGGIKKRGEGRAFPKTLVPQNFKPLDAKGELLAKGNGEKNLVYQKGPPTTRETPGNAKNPRARLLVEEKGQ